MARFGTNFLALLCFAAAGCAPMLPATFQVSASPSPKGSVLAMAHSGRTVVIATPDGLFRREEGGDWIPIDSPGLRKKSRVTALAMLEDELFVATDGDGLHIRSGGTWEVLNSRYGGLGDDHVLCLAADAEGARFFGVDVWVGTAKGLTVRRGEKWEVFTPKDRWLLDLVGRVVPREGKTYITERFSLGGRSGGGGFLPPVTAIGLGADRVVLGGDSRFAVLDSTGYAAIRLDGSYTVRTLIVEEATLWAGTSRGLLWGGRLGVVESLPYPAWRPSLEAWGVVFGTNDTRPYHYVWRQFGFNTARVDGLARDGNAALWVAYNSGERGIRTDAGMGRSSDAPEPTTGLRRYDNLDEYLESGVKPQYEVYGKDQGVLGDPTVLSFSKEQGGVLVGTSKGFVFLK